MISVHFTFSYCNANFAEKFVSIKLCLRVQLYIIWYLSFDIAVKSAICIP